MADTLVERLTGRAAATGPTSRSALVITDRALFAGDHEPATVPGYGPVPRCPPGCAATSVRTRRRTRTRRRRVWLRRLFTHPSTGQLVAMESRARCFPAGAARPAGDPRRGLPHPVVRRAGPARRPRVPGRARRGHRAKPTARGCASSATTSRSARLVGRPGAGQLARPAPHRDRDPDRAPLPVPATTAARRPTTQARPHLAVPHPLARRTRRPGHRLPRPPRQLDPTRHAA